MYSPSPHLLQRGKSQRVDFFCENRGTGVISVSVRKQCVFTVTESQLIYAVLNICLLMESGLTHLTHNITHSLPLSILSPSSGHTGHFAFFFICLVCVFAKAVTFCMIQLLSGSAQSPHSLCTCLHFSQTDSVFPRVTPQLVMCHLHMFPPVIHI